MDFEIQTSNAAGSDAMLAVKVSPPISTSVLIGEPPNAVPFTPPAGFVKVGQAPCKVRLVFRFRLRPWSLEIGLPGEKPFVKKDERHAELARPDRVVVFIDFTTNTKSDLT